jgi:hypothetical protein
MSETVLHAWCVPQRDNVWDSLVFRLMFKNWVVERGRLAGTGAPLPFGHDVDSTRYLLVWELSSPVQHRSQCLLCRAVMSGWGAQLSTWWFSYFLFLLLGGVGICLLKLRGFSVPYCLLSFPIKILLSFSPKHFPSLLHVFFWFYSNGYPSGIFWDQLFPLKSHIVVLI